MRVHSAREVLLLLLLLLMLLPDRFASILSLVLVRRVVEVLRVLHLTSLLHPSNGTSRVTSRVALSIG
jgi:hypothetical protein